MLPTTYEGNLETPLNFLGKSESVSMVHVSPGGRRCIKECHVDLSYLLGSVTYGGAGDGVLEKWTCMIWYNTLKNAHSNSQTCIYVDIYLDI